MRKLGLIIQVGLLALAACGGEVGGSSNAPVESVVDRQNPCLSADGYTEALNAEIKRLLPDGGESVEWKNAYVQTTVFGSREPGYESRGYYLITSSFTAVDRDGVRKSGDVTAKVRERDGKTGCEVDVSSLDWSCGDGSNPASYADKFCSAPVVLQRAPGSRWKSAD